MTKKAKAGKSGGTVLAAFRAVIDKQLPDLLQEVELGPEDTDPDRSDVCDNLWDNYIIGSIDEALSEAGIKEESADAERAYEAAREYFRARYKVLAGEQLKTAATKSAKASAPRSLDELLQKALDRDEWTTARDLVERGANVNPASGHAPLVALLNKAEHAARFAKSADDGATDEEDNAIDFVGLARFLLEKGADPNRRHFGATPVMMAAGLSVELLEVLIEHGGDVSAVDDDGRDALSHVQDVATAKALLSRGVKPTTAALDNAVGCFSNAVSYSKNAKDRAESLALATLLLEAGAPIEPQKSGQSPVPLVRAAAESDTAMLELLLARHPPHPNLLDDRGNTALHVAARDGNEKAVRLLLAAGADPKQKDNQRKTARDVASKNVRALL
ncbi:MAG: ankyrin repeat domain-containing protein [Deltaproteobacteria bacterium]|nr:ankyrin repeat domain-containing protein [Deltaproteobacteria bacterium]